MILIILINIILIFKEGIISNNWLGNSITFFRESLEQYVPVIHFLSNKPLQNLVTENNSHFIMLMIFWIRNLAPGIMRETYLCILMAEVSSEALKWQEMVEKAQLGSCAQGLGSSCGLGSLLLLCVVSGRAGMFKRASSVTYLVLELRQVKYLGLSRTCSLFLFPRLFHMSGLSSMVVSVWSDFLSDDCLHPG